MINVLVVEDSLVTRFYLIAILETDPDIHVIDAVSSGEEALLSVSLRRPDVILMDIHLPGIDGFETTRRIMATTPVPVVVCTADTSFCDVETAMRALEAGAVSALRKPKGLDEAGADIDAAAIINTVKLMSEVKVVRRWNRAPAVTPTLVPPARRDVPCQDVALVAIGASTGGPPIIAKILTALPHDLPVPILIVQHISDGFADGLAEWLGTVSGFPVRVARRGQIPLPRHVYLAPDGFHLRISALGELQTTLEEPRYGLRPSVAVLFESVAEHLGSRAIGVLLTGMGRDGAAELKLMSDQGALTMAQDEASCVVFGMPGEAIKLGAARFVLSPPEIAQVLTTALQQRPSRGEEARPVPGTSTEPVVQILVVEDSPTQLQQLQFVLEEAGFSVIAAANGREGLAAAQSNRVDLVISDIIMPELDGYGLCKALAADQALRHVPVILLTSLGDPRDVIKALAAGASHFIGKPYEAQVLVARVRAVLATQKVRQVDRPEDGTSILFAGQQYMVKADRVQVLDLMLSTYEHALNRNVELARARDELSVANDDLNARIAVHIQAETSLRKASKALSLANSDLAQFVHVASHDLQSPIHTVATCLRLLERRLGDGIEGDAQELIAEAVAAAIGMKALIEDLLVYSRIGHDGVAFRSVDSSAIVDEVIAGFATDREQEGATVTRTDLPTIMADGDQLGRLFHILIENAFKFHGNDPLVVAISAEPREGEWCFSVKDNGIGIEPQYCERIFRIFQKLDSKRGNSGTGIGLAICKKIVDLHHGRIWAESELGKGATFRFTLLPAEDEDCCDLQRGASRSAPWVVSR